MGLIFNKQFDVAMRSRLESRIWKNPPFIVGSNFELEGSGSGDTAWNLKLRDMPMISN